MPKYYPDKISATISDKIYSLFIIVKTIFRKKANSLKFTEKSLYVKFQ